MAGGVNLIPLSILRWQAGGHLIPHLLLPKQILTLLPIFLGVSRHHWIGHLRLTICCPRRNHSFSTLIDLILHDFDIIREWLVRLTQFVLAVRERAIIAKFTLAFGLEKLTNLRLIIAVGYVHHF